MTDLATIQRACASKVHCANCRSSPAQRKILGFPDQCPHGFTAEKLPPPPHTGGHAAAPKRDRADVLVARCAKCQLLACEMARLARSAPCQAKSKIETFACPVVAEARRRMALCATCDKTQYGGDACTLRKGCCFGHWRSQPENQCPDIPPRWTELKLD